MTGQELEHKIASLRMDVSELIRLRVSPDGDRLQIHEAELLSTLASLQFLCADLRESRVKERNLEAAE